MKITVAKAKQLLGHGT